ncbi:MAG: inositol monophosphatase family protein [Nitrososphaeria archaeon]
MRVSDYVEIIERSLTRARKTILDSRREIVVAGYNRFDDITYNIDIESEATIIKEFKESGQGFTIISEEIGKREVNGGGKVVVVDPLDGSNNAVKGIPFYSVSIAVADGERFSDIIASGIINVITGDVILAYERSVFFNREPCHPSKTMELGSAMISIVPRLHKLDESYYPSRLTKLLKEIRYPRFLGSAALETAFVSVGFTDAFVELAPRLRVVDLAASLHMAKISGAYFRLINSDKDLELTYDGRFGCIIAANEKLGNLIAKIVK